MGRLLAILIAAGFWVSFTTQALPLPRPQTAALMPETFTLDYDFEGTVRLNNCSGSLIRFENSSDTDKAVVMTNGHCYEWGFIDSGEYMANQPSSRTFYLLNSQSQSVGSIQATMLLYATMTGTDMSLYRVNLTYSEIQSQFGIRPLTLASAHPPLSLPIAVISGYWHRGYSCAIEAFINRLKESNWSWSDSLRYTRPGCEVIGGTSGSPILASGTRTIVGINNTGNESGGECTMNNPCEIDENGGVHYQAGYSYGQQTYLIYTCLDQNNDLNLQLPGCQLLH